MDESILVKGINIHYDVQGKGDALLLIHGMGFSYDIWDSAIKVASKVYTTYALDLPGFGGSDKPEIAYSPSFYADFIGDFMDATGIGHASLVGISLGGEIAAMFAAKHVDRVKKLVLSAPVGLSPLSKALPGLPILNSSLYLFMSKSRQLFKHYAESTIYNKSALTEELIEREWARLKDPSYRSSLIKNARLLGKVDPAYGHLLRSIQAPTLLVWGRADPVVPLEDAYRYNELIRGSEVSIIEKCGHVPLLERPAEFNHAFMTFLGEEKVYYGIDEEVEEA